MYVIELFFKTPSFIPHFKKQYYSDGIISWRILSINELSDYYKHILFSETNDTPCVLANHVNISIMQLFV